MTLARHAALRLPYGPDVLPLRADRENAVINRIGFIIAIMSAGCALVAHAANGSGPLILSQASPREASPSQTSPPEVCTEVYQPVCATDENGSRKTYSNACFARMAKATNITPGECSK
jgi:Kazal-type serine protease inhibitor domain